ncbi:hypothetical protein WICPIJ_004955 [Wickerhamomyces pijperi]|uniref:Uncharacterized protein n=1 Tax=Wickerhamomyces pijperi TaxID=599730 RepID=A0A9P8TMF0_WICPI|nr:hypothetical protein WICPIJ_004955 [Wickerhamomyces pijperi]
MILNSGASTNLPFSSFNTNIKTLSSLNEPIPPINASSSILKWYSTEILISCEFLENVDIGEENLKALPL